MNKNHNNPNSQPEFIKTENFAVRKSEITCIKRDSLGEVTITIKGAIIFTLFMSSEEFKKMLNCL